MCSTRQHCSALPAPPGTSTAPDGWTRHKWTRSHLNNCRIQQCLKRFRCFRWHFLWILRNWTTELLTDVDVAVISDDVVAEPRGHGEAGQQQRRAPPPRPRPHGGRRNSEYLKQMRINVGVMKQWVARWRPAPAQNKLTAPHS